MPRAGLSPSAVVAEAARLADEVGWERLTLAALAGRLGVRLPSLYKHIASLEGLRSAVGLQALRDLGAALAAAAVGKAGSDALRAMCLAYRDYAHAHPGRYPATIAAPGPQDVERQGLAQGVLQTIQAVLAGYGLRDADAVDAIRVLRAALHGFVALEAAGGFGLPQDVDATFQRLVDTLDENFARWKGDRRRSRAAPRPPERGMLPTDGGAGGR